MNSLTSFAVTVFAQRPLLMRQWKAVNSFLKNVLHIFEILLKVFMWLLIQYLQYLLPIDEQKLSQLKNSNWLSGPLSSSLPTSSVTSPRRLLRPEVLAASSPLEHISLRSGSFRTLYPRLLQFVGNLLDHLASLSSWCIIFAFINLHTAFVYRLAQYCTVSSAKDGHKSL
jgi:hypothetical protein